MRVDLIPGRYVVAVSGGVDSMVLLHALVRDGRHHVIVAHFDHGIRHDSHEDRKLVQDVSKQMGLQFVYDEGKLGAGASEEQARKARYDFLGRVQQASGARAIVTAHHQGDLLETAIINLMRGTNRKGLPALRSRAGLERPLLHKTKQELIAYAKDQGLTWREDSSNQDPRYLRNHIRHSMLSRFSDEDKAALLGHINTIRTVNDELDQHLVNYLHMQPARDQLMRRDFIRLPHVVAREVMAAWLRSHSINTFDKKTLERLVVGAKTFASGRTVDVINGHTIHIGDKTLALIHRDR